MGDTVVVYVDILLFVNAVINSTLLYITYKILGMKPSPLRFTGAVIISTAYGLVVCFPAFSFTLNIFFKALLALLITYIAFDFKNIYVYGKSLLVFLFVSVSYIGIITSFQYMPFSNSAFYINNGEVYYNLPLPYLFIMVAFLCFAQRIVSRFYKRRTNAEEIAKCDIIVDKKTACVHCFSDSGNFLKDTLSGLPVVIIEAEAMGNILPKEAVLCKEEKLFDILGKEDRFKSRLRVVPYKAAGGVSGLLTGFRPDSFKINGKEEKVVIAINKSTMDKQGRYHGIISREIYL